jgi:hypothetical protein
VTLDCPTECPYLRQAREHEKARPLQDLDQSALFPQVNIGEQFLYEQEHLLLGLSFALAKSSRSDRSIRDADLIAALTTLAKTYETLANSGLFYAPPITGLSQQNVVSELQSMVKEYREAEQKHTGQMQLRDADVLRALVFLVRMAQARTNGRPKSRAFVDVLFAQFPEKPSIDVPEETGSRIIL